MKKIYTPTVLLLLLSVMAMSSENSFTEKKKKEQGKFEPTFNYTFIDPTAQPVKQPSMLNSTPFKPMPSLNLQKQNLQEKWRINREPNTGMPMEIEGIKHELSITDLSSETKVKAEAQRLLAQMSVALGVKDASAEFEPIYFENDKQQRAHLKLQQKLNDIEVYGAQCWLHFDTDGSVYWNGRTRPTPANTALKPMVLMDGAQAAALTDYYVNEKKVHDFAAYVSLASYKSTLVLLPSSERLNEFTLAWHITTQPNILKRWEYFINALTGAVIDKYNHNCGAGATTATATDLMGQSKTIHVFQDNIYYLINASKDMYTGSQNSKPGAGKGTIVTLDFQNGTQQSTSYKDITTNNNTGWNATGVSAHSIANATYDYFKSTFNRKSFDNKGGDIVSFINVADDDGGGLDNAYWSGQYMFYGNGRNSFLPLPRGLDVGGHELAHGVTQETAGLEYKDESGALNESFSDIFGCMVDRDDWMMGEDVVKPGVFAGGALRNMADPHNGGSSLNDRGWQPNHMNEKYTGTQDNGGVHINSGIVNRAFYIIANAIGKEKAEQIYYKALSQYLTKTSKFIDLRLAVVKAATDIHGANSTEVNTAKQAFDTVGILDGSGSGTPTNLPTNPGTEFIVYGSNSQGDPNTFYLSDVNFSTFQPLSQVPLNKKASVTDNGSVAVFVGTDNNIYSVLLSSPYTQTQLTNDASWSNAAVSKDGQRVAAVSKFQDTSIYVYDFGKQQWAKFRLYNPTTGGAAVGGVLYSDAIEWDYTGEYVLYDAYNKLSNSGGGYIDYWDMGIINTWSKANNSWGAGTIFKVFNSLESGINIGNATFSKNSPYIIAFDFEDVNAQELSVLGCNMETGNVGVIYPQNLTYGTPSYSKTDGMVAFTGKDNNDAYVIAYVNVGNDKITSSGSAQGKLTDAFYPTLFSTGTRQLPSAINEAEESKLVVYPNPVEDIVNVSGADFSGGGTAALCNSIGEIIWESSFRPMDTKFVRFNIADVAAGNYVLKIRTSAGVSSARLVKAK
ncbi:MAG: M4 family metallopeptidase [Chitinophagales bacterium]